jgi:hypothetical protein
MSKRLCLLVLCLLVPIGCKPEAPAPPDAPASRKVIMPIRRPPDAAAPAAPDAAAARAAPDAAAAHAELTPSKGPVGVAPCDEYLAKMAKCIKRLGPEAAEPMRNAMSESTKAWQANARTPEGKTALVDTCRQALDAAKSAAAAMGCEW